MFLSLKGTLRTEEEIELEKCLNHADKFERGHEDIFEFRLPPLGDLLSAKIMHDNSGLTNPDVRCLSPPHFVPAVCLYFSFRSLVSVTLPQWHLASIEVVSVGTGDSFLFVCGQWLSLEKGHSILERDNETGKNRVGAILENLLKKNSHSIKDIHPVQLEIVDESQSDVIIWLLLEQPDIRKAPILYRYT